MCLFIFIIYDMNLLLQTLHFSFTSPLYSPFSTSYFKCQLRGISRSARLSMAHASVNTLNPGSNPPTLYAIMDLSERS